MDWVRENAYLTFCKINEIKQKFLFLLNLTAQQATLSPLTQSLSNVLISEYSEHTVEFSWRNATFLKIDRLYQCWRNSENTLLQIFPRRENWWNQTMQTATKLSWNFIFQYFKVGSLSQFISSSSSSSRSSLNVFWKVFAEVGYKWLANLSDCKGGSQDNKALTAIWWCWSSCLPLRCLWWFITYKLRTEI